MKRTRVVNLRRGEPFDVYIGRPGHGLAGPWGNPIARGRPCPVCGFYHGRGGTLDCYGVWLAGRICADPAFAAAVRGLHGLTLGCFCKPGPCHGDTLAAAADLLALGYALRSPETP